MTPAPPLPPELLLEIFSYLRLPFLPHDPPPRFLRSYRSQFLNYSLVCKGWKDVAEEEMYGILAIWGREGMREVRDLEGWRRGVAEGDGDGNDPKVDDDENHSPLHESSKATQSSSKSTPTRTPRTPHIPSHKIFGPSFLSNFLSSRSTIHRLYIDLYPQYRSLSKVPLSKSGPIMGLPGYKKCSARGPTGEDGIAALIRALAGNGGGGGGVREVMIRELMGEEVRKERNRHGRSGGVKPARPPILPSALSHLQNLHSLFIQGKISEPPLMINSLLSCLPAGLKILRLEVIDAEERMNAGTASGGVQDPSSFQEGANNDHFPTTPRPDPPFRLRSLSLIDAAISPLWFQTLLVTSRSTLRYLLLMVLPSLERSEVLRGFEGLIVGKEEVDRVDGYESSPPLEHLILNLRYVDVGSGFGEEILSLHHHHNNKPLGQTRHRRRTLAFPNLTSFSLFDEELNQHLLDLLPPWDSSKPPKRIRDAFPPSGSSSSPFPSSSKSQRSQPQTQPSSSSFDNNNSPKGLRRLSLKGSDLTELDIAGWVRKGWDQKGWKKGGMSSLDEFENLPVGSNATRGTSSSASTAIGDRLIGMEWDSMGSIGSTSSASTTTLTSEDFLTSLGSLSNNNNNNTNGGDVDIRASSHDIANSASSNINSNGNGNGYNWWPKTSLKDFDFDRNDHRVRTRNGDLILPHSPTLWNWSTSATTAGGAGANSAVGENSDGLAIPPSNAGGSSTLVSGGEGVSRDVGAHVGGSNSSSWNIDNGDEGWGGDNNNDSNNNEDGDAWGVATATATSTEPWLPQWPSSSASSSAPPPPDQSSASLSKETEKGKGKPKDTLISSALTKEMNFLTSEMTSLTVPASSNLSVDNQTGDRDGGEGGEMVRRSRIIGLCDAMAFEKLLEQRMFWEKWETMIGSSSPPPTEADNSSYYSQNHSHYDYDYNRTATERRRETENRMRGDPLQWVVLSPGITLDRWEEWSGWRIHGKVWGVEEE